MDELARFRLDGKVAVVTGASGGIGARTALALARVGAAVTCAGRSIERLNAVVERIERAGGRAIAVEGDMAAKADADGVAEAAVESFGRLDIIVNTVGGGAGTALYPAHEYPESEWDRIIDLNLRTSLLPTQAAVQAMITAGNGGRVVNFSSVRGQLGIDNGFSAYVAAKGAMDAVSRQWATEWAKHRITVNSIAPTFVRTAQSESLLADKAFYEGLLARIPLHRIAETDDVVGAVLFFCSEASSFVTGQLLTLDGGLTAAQ
ncbi:SDR family NAD(P)-dependent oxidoreductase [Phytoactinopolyspora endophytica]|uniref:SDR family NAD(P)-dependent oxidoreductase n=1 Tax=Phytoactinopolyspora endophytica TaxID=1642495 RepID=UPI00101B66BE|nr:SDR family oxidoreductase [Phytoactinopolyspora endophytica]